MAAGFRSRRTSPLRKAGRALLLLLVPAAGLVSACSSPGLIASSCVRTGDDDQVLEALGSRLRVDGVLRNGQVVEAADDGRFVSAELHRENDDFDVRGEILTWESADGETFRSVDRNARRLSSWPAATADLDDADARTSRACVYPYRGRRTCEGTSAAGPIRVEGDCRTTTTTTATP